MTGIPNLVEAILVATAGGSLCLALATLMDTRLPQVPVDVRRDLTFWALLAGPLILVITLVARPPAEGCLFLCSAPDPRLADLANMTESFRAAGKFGVATSGDGAARGGATIPGNVLLSVLVLAWLGGAAAALGRWLVGALRDRLFVRRARTIRDGELTAHMRALARRVGLSRSVRLLQHDRMPYAVAGGLVRPWICLPQGFEARPEQEVRMVLLHELAHVRRRDPLSTALVRMVGSVFWFSPLVHGALRRLDHLQELAADAAVVRSGISAPAYAQHLLDAFRNPPASGVATLAHAHSIVGRSLLERRVRAILDGADRDGSMGRLPGSILATAALSAVVALAWAPTIIHERLTAQADAAPPVVREQILNADSLDSLLRPIIVNTMAERFIAGAAISVVHEGDVVYQAGFGHRDAYAQEPVDPERTIFRIGSITKAVTGIALLQLVDRGLISLDDDVAALAPELGISDAYPDPVRVRHLLTHTAGFDQVGLGRHVGTREQVRPLGDFLRDYLIRIRPPGELSTYDTYGITLAGYLVEKLSGQPYPEYLRDHIFAPLGMHRSGIVVPPALEPDVAVGYSFAGSWEPARWEFMNTDPASTVNATVADMSRLARMLLNGGEFDGVRILSAQSASSMLAQQFTNHPELPGYSFTLFEDRSRGLNGWSHGGSMTGYGSVLYLLPDHDLGVYMSYSQESSALPGAVLPAFRAAVFPDRSVPLKPRVTGVDVERFAGTYANSLYHHSDPNTGWASFPFELEVDGSTILFEGAPAFPTGPLTFQRDDGMMLAFREDEAGRITHMLVNQTVYERLP